MRDRITTIIEHWFIQEPALFQILCTHELVPNTQMACPVRSGRRRIEYNPDYLREIHEIISNRGENDSAPYLLYLFRKVYEKHFGPKKPYAEII